MDRSRVKEDNEAETLWTRAAVTSAVCDEEYVPSTGVTLQLPDGRKKTASPPTPAA